MKTTWEENLGDNFFNFLNNGLMFTDDEKIILDLIYQASGLKDELFISLIDTLKGRPEFLDEYFTLLKGRFEDIYSIDYLYQVVYESGDFKSESKYLYHFSFVAEYARNFFGDSFNGYIKKIKKIV